MITKGQKINDRYQIVKTIGEGGMANVYLAYDTILERDVAVKVLRGDLANDEKFVRRFQREALSASSLSHPNVVEVYDVGEDDGIYYIVMEYIQGKHLKQLIKKRGRLTLNEVVDIMLQVTDGMSAAHDSYIIHRDIKPQNIMILENGIVKITDFGIAMALNSTQLTQTNSVMGSVHYLPPEQASGKGSTIQSDVYSMGILMYELLSGTLPYRGDNAVEIALKHLKEPLPSIRKECPDLPQSVENIILRACAKNPKNRYVDAREMHDDLETCTSDLRLNEPRYDYKYPELEEAPVKTKTPSKKLEYNNVKEDKEMTVEVKKIDNAKVSKKKENRLLLILGIIFAGLAVVATAVVIAIMVFGGRTDEVKVPDVHGMSVDEAIKALNDAGLEVSEEDKYAQSDEIEEGKVVKTDPSNGRSVKEKSKITLYISQGAKYYEMEDYIGQNYIATKTILEQNYNLFVIIKKDDTGDNSDEPDLVISQEPEVGTKLSPGDTVVLHIPNHTETYPDFTTGEWTQSNIESWCEKYQLTPQFIEEANSEYEPGSIIGQKPAAGSTIVSGMTIKITIATEEEAEEE